MPLFNTENQCCSLWVFKFDTYSLTVSIIAIISLTTVQTMPEYGFSLTRIFWSVLIRENKRQKNFGSGKSHTAHTDTIWSSIPKIDALYYYFVDLRIQSKYRKILTKKNSVSEHFPRSECQMRIYVLVQQLWWNFLSKK